jgi:hypothetical protein
VLVLAAHHLLMLPASSRATATCHGLHRSCRVRVKDGIVVSSLQAFRDNGISKGEGNPRVLQSFHQPFPIFFYFFKTQNPDEVSGV